jgi:hypothetical protein
MLIHQFFYVTLVACCYFDLLSLLYYMDNDRHVMIIVHYMVFCCLICLREVNCFLYLSCILIFLDYYTHGITLICLDYHDHGITLFIM